MRLFIGFQNSGLTHIVGSRTKLMQNLPNLPWQYSRCQTKGEEIEKCLEEGLGPTYHFSTFSHTNTELDKVLLVLYKF